jgi:hypothetical protein
MRDSEHLAEMKAQLAELKAVMSGIKDGTINVKVINQPGAGPPSSGGGRSNVAATP